MNLSFTDEQRAVRELFAGLFGKESTPDRVREAEAVGHDPALWDHIIATGALGVAVPEPAGGAGAGLLELALIAEEAGRHLASVPLAEPAAAARLLAALGSQQLLDQALAGDALVTLTTRTTPLGGQLLPDGAVADVVLVLDGDQVRAVRRPDGVRSITNMGGLPMARWSGFDQGEVIGAGPEVVALFAAAVDEVRVMRAASLVGLAGEAIEIGAAYARERQAFGIAIGTYQAVAHPLADALVAKDGAQMLVWKACWALDTEQPSGPRLAAMAFVFVAETAFAAAQHSLHIHGGYGFMAEYDVQLYYRRAKAWVTTFADPVRELQTVADRSFGVPSSRATAPLSTGVS